ncbi:MAG: heavy-metal-associated domain-containing protein [Proteobacteria bacterium]|nr:heavy-metal-associated domain-containing protein [Pseudomonadota bacterium]
MKKISVTFVIALFFWSIVYAAGTEYELGIDGVACPFCVYGIEKQLSKLEGIERISTDIKNGLVLLEMKDGSTLTEQLINEAVNKAGFTLRSFAQTDNSK